MSFQNVALPRNLVKIYHLYRHVDCGIYTLINFFIFCVSIYIVFCISVYIQSVMIHWLVADEFEKIWKEAVTV